MPGQTHNRLFPGFSQNGWFSGLNGNAVKQKPGLADSMMRQAASFTPTLLPPDSSTASHSAMA